ncbi:MAG: hypothetical protein Aurels2KO_57230 [Aureliella sp.]
MNLLTIASRAADDGGWIGGLVIILIVIGACCAISDANKPKGYVVKERNHREVTPKR